jgi:hypothetical protein
MSTLRRAGDVIKMEEDRSSFKNLTGKRTGNRLFGRTMRKSESNI